MAAVGSVIVVAVVIVSAVDAVVCCEVIAGVDVMVVVCSWISQAQRGTPSCNRAARSPANCVVVVEVVVAVAYNYLTENPAPELDYEPVSQGEPYIIGFGAGQTYLCCGDCWRGCCDCCGCG